MRNVLLFAASLIPALCFAQTGSNYDCAHAIPLPVSSDNVAPYFIPLDGVDLISAVPSPITACSGSGNRGSAWYTFVASATTQWVREEGDGYDDAGVDIFSGSCGSLTLVECIPGNSANTPLTGLSIGSTYYVRVVMSAPSLCSANGCFVGLAVVSAPVHDECAGAVELFPVSPTSVAYPGTQMSSIGATQSLPGCVNAQAAASNDDVWYRFTATATSHHFVTSKLAGGDPTVEWFSGSCGSLTSIQCNNPHATGLMPGQQYFIRVYSSSIDPDVTIRLMGDLFSSAPNDACSGAFPITAAQGSEAADAIRVSTWLGTQSTSPCSAEISDVWLSFTAPATTVSVVNSSNQYIRLLTGTCGSLTCVSEGSSSPIVTFNGLTIGDSYYLKIGTSTSYSNAILRMFAPPSNDECTGAITLPMAAYGDADTYVEGYTFGATESMVECGGGSSDDDVWYTFTATRSRHLISLDPYVLPGSMHVEVFSGTCGTLTSVYCGQTSIVAADVTGLAPGQSYFLRAYTTSGRTAYRIRVMEGPPNDDCAGAMELPFSTLADHGMIRNVTNVDALNGTGTCGTTSDLWFRFTAASSSAGFVAAVQNGAAGTVSVELLSGVCGSLTSIACEQALDIKAVITKFTGLTAGAEYHIKVASLSALPYKPMLFDRPANDEITGALDVPVGGATFAQPANEAWNFGATESYPTFCGPANTPDEDTWFHFTATATTHTVRATQGNLHFRAEPITGLLRLEVYDVLSTIADTLEAHVIGCGGSPVELTGLTVGDGYWYRVFTAQAGAANTCAFATSVADSNNDDAVGALRIDYSNTFLTLFNTAGATQTSPGADCSVDDLADDDIWFRFTATASPARLATSHHNADLTLELFSGAPGNLISIACSDNILVLPTITPGQTYYARLYSWKNATPVNGRIGLISTPSLTANSCVDETCLGPVLLANPGIEPGEYCLPTLIPLNAVEGLGTLLAPGWPRMLQGSADNYSSCNDHDNAMENPAQSFFGTGGRRVLSRSGSGMAGLFAKDPSPEYREYIEAELSAPLVPGEAYLVSFHLTPAPGIILFVNGFGAALTQGPIVELSFTAPDIVPQVRSLDVVQGDGWVNICGIVVPDVPWDHITIGVFYKEIDQFRYIGTLGGNTNSYYLVDDVVVALVADPSCITSIGDVPPLDEDAATSGDNLRIYPNPANDRVTIVADAMLFGERGVIEVFDATGKRVHAEQVSNFGALQPLELPAEWKEGLYLVMVRMDGQAPRTARVVVKR